MVSAGGSSRRSRTRRDRLGLARVTLYTNARMHENLVLYPRLGYVEIDRRREDGFDRVYFEKMLRGAVDRA